MTLTRRSLLSAMGSSLIPPTASGQPAPALTPSVAARPVRSHDFRTFLFTSADGLRRYRVAVAVPKAAPPAGGYSSLMLCDGNAAFMAPSPADLEAVPGLALVALGYDAPVRHDLVARNYDYTPPVNGADTVDEFAPAIRAGGSDLFAALIRDVVLPRLAADIALDAARRGLWGHSYGGLFVLSTLFKHPDLFRLHVSASPSLWWYEGRAFAGAPVKAPGPREVLLVIGDAEVNRRIVAGRAMPDAAAAVAALRALGERLRTAGAVEVTMRVLPGLGHGQVFAAALPLGLGFAAERL